jgi:hypothetical protein
MAHPTNVSTQPEDERWTIFAAVLFSVLAIANLMWGITALVEDQYFTADELLFGDLSMWGGIHLAFAAVQGIIAVLLVRGSPVGAIAGSLVALLHATAVLMTVGAYPLWSVIQLTIDGLVIYGLIVHGRTARTSS